jgi:hypothetical protein
LSNGGLIPLLIKSALLLCALIVVNALFSVSGPTLTLKKEFASAKTNICLGDIVNAGDISARDADKLNRYCQIELKGERSTITAKEIELHAWAAGVIPGKIAGAQILLVHDKNVASEKKSATNTSQKLRRGSAIRLVLKSEHMQIAREAVILMDAFPGETVDVRLNGTRKNLRAKLVNSETAEYISP